MSVKKILKNNTESSMTILNREVAASESYDVPHGQWHKLADDDGIITQIESGDIIVNNGIEDLQITVAKVHAKEGVLKVHKDMDLIASGGENAPGLEEINHASLALSVDIGDKFYSSKHVDNLIGDNVKFKFYMCVNNTDLDKWGQANIYYTTTSGMMDKQMNAHTGEVVVGPVEVPTTPYLIFYAEIVIPATAFQEGKDILFVGIERVSPTDKPPLESPFYILKYEVEYWKKVIA